MKKKLCVVFFMMLCFANVAMAETKTEASVWEESHTMTSILALPVTAPANLLALPYWGAKEALNAIEKIPSEAGKSASVVALLPLLVPAAVLNFPSFLLSETGLTGGY